MSSVEAEGSTIDDAINGALRALGAERERVEIEILASPTKGLFGLGGRKAKVRATIRAPIGIDYDEFVARPSTPTTRPAPLPAPPVAVIATSPQPDRPTAPAPKPRALPRTDPGPDSAVLLPKAQALLQEVLGKMGFDVSVTATGDEEGIVQLVINGDSSGVLIGRYGQTLDALEYFVHRVLARGDDVGRISIDCEEYRVRRRETLVATATRLAEQARAKGKVMTMEALSPRDRRIVHLVLRGDTSLTTRSNGDGYYRDLVIVPVGARSPRSNGPRRGRAPRGNDRSAAN